MAMKIRQKALAQFGENNIRPSMPLAKLEDVLVPVYFYHRYQLEAASKLVGGMNYSYALRGDNQVVTKPLERSVQLSALNAIIDCIDPEVLALPEQIIHMIPPRPEGYDFTRELFKKRTGLAFDALSPAEAAVDLPFSLLFNSQRVNRMSQYKLENNGLGLDEMIQLLINKTWKSVRKKGMFGLIQMQNEQLLLTYMLAGSIDENNSFISRAIIVKELNDLKKFIERESKETKDDLYKGHLLLALERMKAPEKAKATLILPMPPGGPIGMDADEE